MHEPEEAVFEEIEENVQDVNTDDENYDKPSKLDMVRALKDAVTSGNISRADAQRYRREMGISSTMFTKKLISASARKSKRKLQKAARKTQRK